MKKPDTALFDLLLATTLVSLLAGLALAQPAAPKASFSAPEVDLSRRDLGLQARALAPGVWVVEGANADFSPSNGCNIINTGFIATGSGVLVINTGTSRLQGEQLRALIARTTVEPVRRVIHLNLHPDYFLGNQGFADVPRAATAATRAGIAREAAAYEANLYRLCGDWMAGTETLAPDETLTPPPAGTPWQPWPDASAQAAPTAPKARFELRELQGHTASDLVLIDRQSGVAFVGGLVFAQRVPTTPHARLADWLRSLDELEVLGLQTVVPSHGPVHVGNAGLQATRRYLRWLDQHFARAAAQGLDMNELLRAPVPPEFAGWAAFGTEYLRNIAHLYPAYEQAVLALPRR